MTVVAPRERIPLFARAGSIVPLGPEVQWTGEDPQGTLTVHVFAGADGTFTLYEDQGTDMGYARGEFARIPMRWDDAGRTLTLGAREGSFPGMVQQRRIELVVHDGNGGGPAFATAPAKAVTYTGAPLVISP